MIVFHIGPSKTASTSIQAVIPNLGRPFLIKPPWMKPAFQAGRVQLAEKINAPDGAIVSDEFVGDFTFRTPRATADLIEFLFGRCVIVFVNRQPAEHLESLYRQRLSDSAPYHLSFAEFKSEAYRFYKKNQTGPYAGYDLAGVRRGFENHDLRVLEFDLLKENPDAFFTSFCTACGIVAPTIAFPHLNESLPLKDRVDAHGAMKESQ